MSLSAGLGIECPLALPHSPIISWTWYWMPSDTTTQSHYQLDLELNGLWHYHTVPLSAGLGIECPLALPHSPVNSLAWHWMSSGTTKAFLSTTSQCFHPITLYSRFGCRNGHGLDQYWMPSGNIIQTHYQLHRLGITTQFCYQLGLVLNTHWGYHTALLSAAWAWYWIPWQYHSHIINWT